jgi:hypothetical protein
MLADFQQALADLTASPTLCRSVRERPEILLERYSLSSRELARLAAIVRHPGMACACTVYRANRLAPLALNVPGTCKALGPQLKDLAVEYWARFPEGNVHFFVEADRFCTFVREKLKEGVVHGDTLTAALESEHSAVSLALLGSRLEHE